MRPRQGGVKGSQFEVYWRAICLSLCCSLQLIQSPALAPLGLVMLKTTSEELACPREDLSVARKEELRKLLLDQVPTVLGLLTGERKRWAFFLTFPECGCNCRRASARSFAQRLKHEAAPANWKKTKALLWIINFPVAVLML